MKDEDFSWVSSFQVNVNKNFKEGEGVLNIVGFVYCRNVMFGHQPLVQYKKNFYCAKILGKPQA